MFLVTLRQSRNVFDSFFTFDRTKSDWSSGLQVAVFVTIPLIVALFANQLALGLVASLGAFYVSLHLEDINQVRLVRVKAISRPGQLLLQS